MSRGDAIQALDNPYRQAILKVLKRGRTGYSDLFNHLEPDGDDRGRFNYHLRSLRNADLVRLTNGLYGLTPGGEAALVFLGEVSERSEARPRPKQEIRADERGWGRRVGDAWRLRKSIHSFSGGGGILTGGVKSVGYGVIIAGLSWLFLAFMAGLGGHYDGYFGSLLVPMPVALLLLWLAFLGGPALVISGIVLLVRPAKKAPIPS